jgi:hypothetical protein
MVNESVSEVAQSFGFEGTYMSHSFRVRRINKLLEEFPLTTVALKIGHQKIESTYQYSRNFESEEDLKKLEEIDQLSEYVIPK